MIDIDVTSFREFLEDYAMKEEQEYRNFLQKSKEGRIPPEERYPPLSRFAKAREPIALPPATDSVWCAVPFYGSTIIPLFPRTDRQRFDELYSARGFTARDIDRMIDAVKQTGRIQFSILDPRLYANLEFLEPLFRELRPPSLRILNLAEIVGEKTYNEYLAEFTTLADFGFEHLVFSVLRHIDPAVDTRYMSIRLQHYADDYVALKCLGYHELADEIGNAMITDPSYANELFAVFGNLVAVPSIDRMKPIYNFSRDELATAVEMGKKYDVKIQHRIPHEIGKFILENIVFYPQTLDGCMEILQHYDERELWKVVHALDEGIKKTSPDLIDEKKQKLSEVLDSIWKDADKIKVNGLAISGGISLGIGIVGELATGTPGVGLLSALGFQCVDRLTGIRLDSLSERIAKLVSPNYLVAVYDFKSRHPLPKR